MDFKQYLAELTSRPIPKEMGFPQQEYGRRVEKVRAAMADRDLDVLLVTDVPNICYLTGFETAFPGGFTCLTLPCDEPPTLQVPEFEIPGALLNTLVEDVRSSRFTDPDAATREFAGTLAGRGFDGRHIGVETRLPGLSAGVYEALREALPRATFTEASELVFGARLVKSPAELDHMRRSADIVRTAISEAVKVAAEGVSENEIAGVAYAALAKAGSEYFSCQPCVMGGHRNGWIHTSQRRTSLKRGDTVMMEMGAFYYRYSSAVMHTVSIGEPSATIRRLVKASHETLGIIEETVKPGRSADEVAREAKKGLESVRDEAYSTGMFGYSMGISFPPTWREGSFVIAEGVQQTFEPGMTFLSPITLRIPGTLGVGFSDTFVVTESGCEPLTKRDRSLTVAAA